MNFSFETKKAQNKYLFAKFKKIDFIFEIGIIELVNVPNFSASQI